MNVAEHGDDQSPGEFGGSLSGAGRSADGDTQLGCGFDVERGVAQTGGHQQFQFGQLGEYRPGEGGSFPHTHDHVEIFEPVNQRCFVGDMVLEEFNIRSGSQLAPIAQVLGCALVII